MYDPYLMYYIHEQERQKIQYPNETNEAFIKRNFLPTSWYMVGIASIILVLMLG